MGTPVVIPGQCHRANTSLLFLILSGTAQATLDDLLVPAADDGHHLATVTVALSQTYESTAADQQQFLIFLLHIITLFALAIYVRVNTIKNNILAGLFR
jgi:hypothetical protein